MWCLEFFHRRDRHFSQPNHKVTGKSESPALLLQDIDSDREPRLTMHSAEFNRVLGNGLVPGSVVLVGVIPASANPQLFAAGGRCLFCERCSSLHRREESTARSN